MPYGIALETFKKNLYLANIWRDEEEWETILKELREYLAYIDGHKWDTNAMST